tara:strand:+ start:131 stop:331 length:201 start_codon:yes stop_codon:yes gene_type:complete
MKELLEQISVALGYDGEINEQVEQWVEIVQDELGHTGDDLIEFIQWSLRQWTRTGHMVLTGILGVE